MIRINFQPYTTPQLEKIVQTRLQSAKEGLQGKDKELNVIAPDGIKFAAMKVSSISGDARRVLDICRFVHDASLHDSVLIQLISCELFSQTYSRASPAEETNCQD
jgi:Cdc6-like AAA superfamily ATPase